ncbi:hypothetical protein GP486_000633 [Trichoglossum hirsutum]|uniref:Xylose isomerase-like TIM barrel domain-containing protein n=1 Tax=Trichoglossum hirsutum TaxID=265104 RepID=A0A9P8RTD2_9PEZI|nr:hypothetical protein GP486_000633 [Trichoglossum hirsutum]
MSTTSKINDFPANPSSIATFSLGHRANHTLPTRLCAAASAGFTHVELFDDDWSTHLTLALQSQHLPPSVSPWDAAPDNLRIARNLGLLVRSLGLTIVCSQPARDVEGILDPSDRAAALRDVAARFPFLRAMGTEMMFLCASTRDEEGVSHDPGVVARDLAELGDMAAAFARADGGPTIRIAYEGLSWATQNNTWQRSWDIVNRANRPNVGLVIDTFHILVQEFASPLNPTTSSPPTSTKEALAGLRASMSSLSASVLGSKVFLVQISDAAIIEPAEFWALGSTHMERLRTYARTRRLYPGENGGWMPTDIVVEAVRRSGYKGPWSLEVFHSRLEDPGNDLPWREAEKGYESLRWLTEARERMRGRRSGR